MDKYDIIEPPSDVLSRTVLAVVVILISVSFFFNFFLNSRILSEVEQLSNQHHQIRSDVAAVNDEVDNLLDRTDCFALLFSFTEAERIQILRSGNIEQICGVGIFFLEGGQEVNPLSPE